MGLSARAIEVHEAVVRDGVEPRAEAGAGFVAPAEVDHAHPHVLKKLLRRRDVADLAEQKTLKGTAVAAIEGLERARVAAGVAQHQLFVGRPAPHAGLV